MPKIISQKKPQMPEPKFFENSQDFEDMKYIPEIVNYFDIPMPTIFSDKNTGYTAAYFGGPWLNMENLMHFSKYLSDIQYPLNALEMPEKKENIINGILKLTENNGTMFGNDKDTLNNDLENLLSIKEKRLYKQWTQETNGKERKLSVPNNMLEHMLKKYVKEIILKAPVHKKACGGEQGWSTTKMIRAHMPFKSVLSCDIPRAFESVESNFVFEFYYDLAREHLPEDISRDTAGFLTTMSTVEYYTYGGSALPQGSPISMVLFNRILYSVDKLFEKKCQKEGMYYSRWVDDIIITSKSPQKDYCRMAQILSAVRTEYAMPLHKVFFQNREPFYILGQEIKGMEIKKSENNAAKNARQPVPEHMYQTPFENSTENI